MTFLRQSIVSLLGKVGGAFLGMISGILLARLMGPQGLGQYQLFLSTQTLVVTIFSLGVGNASIYFINKRSFDKATVITVILRNFIPISIGVSLLFGFMVLVFPSYFGSVSILALFVFVTGTGSLLFTLFLRPLLYTEQKILKLAILMLIPTSVLLLGLTISFFFVHIEVEVPLSLWGVGNVVVLVILLRHYHGYYVRKIGRKTSILKKLFGYGIKLSASNLVTVINANLVIFLIKGLAKDGFEDVGVFSRATAITTMIMMIPNSIGPLLYSNWSGKGKAELRSEISQKLRILLFSTFVVCVFVFIFRSQIVSLLYGPLFLEAAIILPILILASLFYTVTEVWNNVFASIGSAGITLIVFIVSSFVIFLIGILAIHDFGIVGAAYAVLAGAAANAVVLSYLGKRRFALKLFDTFIIRKTDIHKIIYLINKLK